MPTSVATPIQILKHSVGVVLVDDRDPTGLVKMVRMEYTKYNRTSVRHIVETGEGEDILDTLSSSKHEARISESASFDYDLVQDEPIYMDLAPFDGIPTARILKIWYVARPVGQLRNFSSSDGRVNPETLGPVSMVEARALLAEMDRRLTPRNHISAAYAALAALGSNRKIFETYQKEILSWTWALEGMKPEEQAAIEEYRSRH